MPNNFGFVLLAMTAIVAAACSTEPSDMCGKYCTQTLDYCGPGSDDDVKACTDRCRLDMEGKSALCEDRFADYAGCLWNANGCDAPECEPLFDPWATECYATGNLAGPFELHIKAQETVTGTWTPGDPTDLLTCTFPITATAVRGGIARWDAVDWTLYAVDGGNFCGGGLSVNAGLVDFWGSDLIKAGETQIASADRSCSESFEAVFRFDYLDPDGVLQSIDATATCLAP